jgi:hypothetical protein
MPGLWRTIIAAALASLSWFNSGRMERIMGELYSML